MYTVPQHDWFESGEAVFVCVARSQTLGIGISKSSNDYPFDYQWWLYRVTTTNFQTASWRRRRRFGPLPAASARLQEPVSPTAQFAVGFTSWLTDLPLAN